MKWFKKQVKPTGKVIDMTRKYWGHNFEIMGWENKSKETFKAAMWYGYGPNVGDVMEWRDAEGRTRKGLIVDVERAPSVWDMYFIKVLLQS